MQRRLFTEDHEIFRDAFRKFQEKEVTPNHAQWEKQGIVPREVWRKAGEQGFLCTWMPEEYGGSNADFLYSVIIAEEAARVGNHGFALSLHSDIVAPYIWSFGTEEQKKRWLPGCVSGEKILAVAMTEPGAGSDLASLRTTAIRKNGNYVINGQKTFISNGLLSDIVIVAAKTDPNAQPAHSGVSLLVVEREAKGFNRGRRLEKMGLHAQDTAELLFEDCVVPQENLLGEEGAGFVYLMLKLQQERLMCAIGAQAASEKVLEDTMVYVKERVAFGKPISKFQNTRFKLAEVASEIEVGRAFVDKLIREHMAGEEVIKETCMAKYWITETHKKVVDECLQFFGGYGYMLEYPIAKAYLDARVQTIFAGTTEIMKEVIGRRMGL